MRHCHALQLILCVIALSSSGCTASGLSAGPRTMPVEVAAGLSKNSALLYVANDFGGNTIVNFFTYPKVKPVGSVTSNMSFARVCSDPKTGHVFVTQFNGLNEYERGETTKIATLPAPEPYTQLDGCSIDPLSGDVAAVAYESYGGLIIFRHGNLVTSVYTDPSIHAYYNCAYDDRGNLFVLGYGVSGTYITSVFTELAKGASAFRDIQLNRFLGYPQKLQWDGKYMAIDAGNTIYRVQISGSLGTIVGTTQLLGDMVGAGGAAWIAGGKVFGPYGRDASRYVGIWKYPAGGNPLRVTPKVGGGRMIISDVNLSVTK